MRDPMTDSEKAELAYEYAQSQQANRQETVKERATDPFHEPDPYAESEDKPEDTGDTW